MRRLIPLVTAALVLLHAAPVFAGPGISYGPPEVMKQRWVTIAPHVYLVTTYWRPVYKNNIYQYHEKLPDETSADACYAFWGDPYPDPATPPQWGADGHLYLIQTYSQKLYHRNNAYGTFVVETSQNPALTKRTDVTPEYVLVNLAKAPVKVPVSPDGPRDLLQAARNVTNATDFDDYRSQITTNTYQDDIAVATQKGLIQGRYDANSRYYDPNSLITVGEMANILARNFGAAPDAKGNEALAYLRSLGVALAKDPNAPLDVATLKSMAQGLAERKGLVDLQVLNDALNGTLVTDLNGGITRGHAVQIAEPATPPTTATSDQTANKDTTTSSTTSAGPAASSQTGQTATGSSGNRSSAGGQQAASHNPPVPPPPVIPPGADFTLAASLNPAAVGPGEPSLLTATTSLPANRVVAVFWDGRTIELTFDGARWRASITAPQETSDTTLSLQVEAYRGTLKKTLTLGLSVLGPWQEMWRFVLSD